MNFLEAVQLGKNDWWRYLLATVLILVLWFGVGAVPLIGLVIWVAADNDPGTQVDTNTGQFIGLDPLLSFLVLMFSFVMLWVGLFIAVRFIHQRRFRSLIEPNLRVRWGRMAQGFAVWVTLAAILAIVEAVLYPGRYQFTFDAARFIPFAFFILLLIPLQAASEELLVRAYLMQSLSLFLRQPILLSIISGGVFALLHLANPEVLIDFWLLMLYYFAFGFTLALISLKDNGLELAIGAHVGNNLFTALFANYANGALATPSVFMANELDAVYGVLSALVAMVIFYGVCAWVWRPASPVQAANVT